MVQSIESCESPRRATAMSPFCLYCRSSRLSNLLASSCFLVILPTLFPRIMIKYSIYLFFSFPVFIIVPFRCLPSSLISTAFVISNIAYLQCCLSALLATLLKKFLKEFEASVYVFKSPSIFVLPIPNSALVLPFSLPPSV